MNQYPVLYVSFKDVEGLDFDAAYGMLKAGLAEVCKNIVGIMDSDKIDLDDTNAFYRLKSESGNNIDVKYSLKTLMRIMYSIYGKQVILLIDEYDVPLAKATETGGLKKNYYQQMLDVIKGITSTALKDNDYLKFAVITGCLRIAKESIFTGTNNFASYSVLDERFSEYFGFSELEIVSMLEEADRNEAADTMRKWYDGYIFGKSHVYCPWDVMNNISAIKFNRNAKPKNYWKNTSHNGILFSFVKNTDFDVADKFERLLNGGTIMQTISN